MNTDKVRRRIAELAKPGGVSPERLERLARDLGFALARGERAPLADAARSLAANAPRRARSRAAPAEDTAWAAGYAACFGTLLAAYEAAHERVDARDAAVRALSSDVAIGVVRALTEGPATGAELAARLSVTPGATSKILTQLRGAGLARVAGGRPYPKRGARKPHVLTSLGSWAADELAQSETAGRDQPDDAIRDAG